MQEKNTDNPVKGWRVEIESKAAKAAAEAEGSAYAPTVELFAEYDTDEFSAGEANGGKIVLATKDGIRIHTDLLGLCDCHGISNGVLVGLMNKVKTPGGWIESAARDLTKKYDGDLKVRLTALGEKPEIDAEATRKASPALTEGDFTTMRIGGRPFVENGTVMSDGRTIFNTAFAADLGKILSAHVKAETGVDAEVGFSEITTNGCEYNYAEYSLECASREDALKVLKEVFRIRNAEALTPRWTADADASGRRTVRYAFGMVDAMC